MQTLDIDDRLGRSDLQLGFTAFAALAGDDKSETAYRQRQTRPSVFVRDMIFLRKSKNKTIYVFLFTNVDARGIDNHHTAFNYTGSTLDHDGVAFFQIEQIADIDGKLCRFAKKTSPLLAWPTGLRHGLRKKHILRQERDCVRFPSFSITVIGSAKKKAACFLRMENRAASLSKG